jgi:leucyl aminopeptidase
MKINVLTQDVTEFTGDTLVINIFQDVTSPGGATGAADRTMGGSISKLINNGEISGKLGETVLLRQCSGLKPEKLIIVGLGRQEDLDYEAVRKAAGAAAKKARQAKTRHAGTIIHGAGTGGLDAALAAQAIVEGTILSLYNFTAYKKPEDSHRIATLTIVEKDRKKASRVRKAIRMGSILAAAQNIARDLINEPANNLTPEKLLSRVKKQIRDLGLEKKVKCQHLNRKELQRIGMGALLSVAQGSSHAPKFIMLRIKSAEKPLVCLIGKTVTFDSGGISIKPSSGMGSMKGDMAGGAIAIGTTLALALAGGQINLLTLIPAVENMPSGSAYRPGDVVRAMNGKTIEIVSTDAEGRLTLADALVYAEKESAKVIIDIATLTGGCVVALGNSIAALMANEQTLVNEVLKASKYSGEVFWQLPLHKEYQKLIRSDVADLKNSGGRYASTITAGLFLQAFVDKAKWLHIDVAGKELTEKENHYTPVGGTGFGVRTLYEMVRNLR